MAYNNQGHRQIQTVEESLHWISFNLKKLVEEVKILGNQLNNQNPNFPSPTAPTYTAELPKRQQNFEQRPYRGPEQQEIPF